jgi:hypothetical protein
MEVPSWTDVCVRSFWLVAEDLAHPSVSQRYGAVLMHLGDVCPIDYSSHPSSAHYTPYQNSSCTPVTLDTRSKRFSCARSQCAR